MDGRHARPPHELYPEYPPLTTPPNPAARPAEATRRDHVIAPVARRGHPARRARALALAASVLSTGGVAAALAYADRGSAADDVVAASLQTTDDSAPPAASSAGGSAGVPSGSESGGPASTSGAATYADGVWTGTPAHTRWGDVQVQVTIRDGEITAVEALEYPASGKSSAINRRAIPVLESEAVAAQAADLDVVSGATYTSRSYETSLQAALDAAAQAG